MEPWFLENEVLRVSGNYELVMFTAAAAVLQEAASLEPDDAEAICKVLMEDEKNMAQCTMLFENEG